MANIREWLESAEAQAGERIEAIVVGKHDHADWDRLARRMFDYAEPALQPESDLPKWFPAFRRALIERAAVCGDEDAHSWGAREACKMLANRSRQYGRA